MEYNIETFTNTNGHLYFRTTVSAMPFIRSTKKVTEEQFIQAADTYYNRPKTHDLAYKKMAQNRWGALNQRCVNGKWAQSSTAQFRSYQKHQTQIQMTKEEFIGWMESQKARYFEILATGDVPSIDRIDNSGHYSLSNIQLLSRHENLEKRWGRELRKMTEEEKVKVRESHARTYQKNKNKAV